MTGLSASGGRSRFVSVVGMSGGAALCGRRSAAGRRSDSVPSVLHVVEVDVERTHRDLNFADGDAERSDQRQQRGAEDVGGHERQADVEQEHRHDAQEKAGDSQNLHGARKVEAPAQILDLRGRQVGAVLEVLRLERADQLGVGEEPVGVGQQDE